MKTKFCLFIFLVTFQIGYAQNYELIDNKVLNYPKFETINTLSIRIQNDFKTDLERVRAAYTWIANTINYDLKTAHKPQKVTLFKFRTEREYQEQKEAYYKGKIETAWQTKKAICIDYSLLFNHLCKLLNIESEVIRGVTKVAPNDINKIRDIKDHAWNAVKINNQWQLIDVTWSTGYEDENANWVKTFNDFFFLTPSEHFLASHYPESKKWQLVNKPISLKQFFSKPILYAKYYEHKIKFDPDQEGSIHVKDNRIELTFSDVTTKTQLFYTLGNDTYIKELRIKKDKNNSYRATIKYKSTENNILTLYTDNQAIADFKVYGNNESR